MRIDFSPPPGQTSLLDALHEQKRPSFSACVIKESRRALPEAQIDGETFSEELDGKRLRTQQERVMDLMEDGHYRTLREIADQVHGSEASVSARLRDCRKMGHIVNRSRMPGCPGIWQYQLLLTS